MVAIGMLLIEETISILLLCDGHSFVHGVYVRKITIRDIVWISASPIHPETVPVAPRRTCPICLCGVGPRAFGAG